MNKLLSIVGWLGGIAIIVWIVFCTNFVYSNTKTYRQWADNYEAIEAGAGENNAMISSEDKEALRDDFVKYLETSEESTFEHLNHRSPTDADRPFATRAGSVLTITVINEDTQQFSELWKEGIREYWAHSWSSKLNESQRVMLAFIAHHFDEVEFVNALGADKIDVKALRPDWIK